ncbi:MAG TPA: hypothetical protein VFE17_12440, partial [Candidatus Baltobacteraceae bacterium]|nr:hypothetical protein [Candidatus Baltobacteraceae bacterium]
RGVFIAALSWDANSAKYALSCHPEPVEGCERYRLTKKGAALLQRLSRFDVHRRRDTHQP